MEFPRANRLFAWRLATRVPRAGRQARSRPERAEDAARPEDCHPGRAHLRDPGPRNAGEGSVLGPRSPKLRTRNFSGRDDKRWNSHAPTDSLLGAWQLSFRAFAAPKRLRPRRRGSKRASACDQFRILAYVAASDAGAKSGPLEHVRAFLDTRREDACLGSRLDPKSRRRDSGAGMTKLRERCRIANPPGPITFAGANRSVGRR